MKAFIFLIALGMGYSKQIVCYALGAVGATPYDNGLSVNIRGGEAASELYSILKAGGADVLAPNVSAYKAQDMQVGVIHDFSYRFGADFFVDKNTIYQEKRTATVSDIEFKGAIARTLFSLMQKAETNSDLNINVDPHSFSGKTISCNEVVSQTHTEYACMISVVF